MDNSGDEVDRIQHLEDKLVRSRILIPNHITEIHKIMMNETLKYLDSVPAKISRTKPPNQNIHNIIKTLDFEDQGVDSKELEMQLKRQIKLLQILYKGQNKSLKKIIDEI